jgi:adenylate cyclase
MPYIIQNAGTTEERVCTLRYGSNTVGRGLDNAIVVEDDARSLSRHHADIKVMDTGIFVTDLNSSNGTFVNQVRITHQRIKGGDLLQFGSVVFKFIDDTVVKPPVIPAMASTNAGLSILARVSPEKSRVAMGEILRSNAGGLPTGSVLLIAEDDNDHQRTANKLRILLEVTQQLSSPEAAASLPEKILDLLFQIMNVDRAALLLVNETTNELEPKALKARAGISIDYEFYSKRIVTFVRENGDAIVTEDASMDRRFNTSHSIIQQSIQAAMCVPLKPKDQTIGVLYVDNLSMTSIYNKEDLEFLASLATQAAIAIENAVLNKRMQTELVRRGKLERFFPSAVAKKIEEEFDLKRIIETEVTVLFSDITGFTEMSAQMPPRQVLEFLNEYFKVMVEDIVFPLGGVLEKYIADALLALWGSPYRKADDAIQGINAAIAMQWAMQRLNEQWSRQGRNLQFQIHIGLNTGTVAAGNIGSEKLIQYTNIGDTMNVASRICSAAKADEILISETTRAQITALNLPLDQLEPVMVKGKTEPLQLYRVRWQELPVPELLFRTRTGVLEMGG